MEFSIFFCYLNINLRVNQILFMNQSFWMRIADLIPSDDGRLARPTSSLTDLLMVTCWSSSLAFLFFDRLIIQLVWPVFRCQTSGFSRCSSFFFFLFSYLKIFFTILIAYRTLLWPDRSSHSPVHYLLNIICLKFQCTLSSDLSSDLVSRMFLSFLSFVFFFLFFLHLYSLSDIFHFCNTFFSFIPL